MQNHLLPGRPHGFRRFFNEVFKKREQSNDLEEFVKSTLRKKFSKEARSQLEQIDRRIITYNPKIAEARVDISGLNYEEALVFESFLRLQFFQRCPNKVRMHLADEVANWDNEIESPTSGQRMTYLYIQETRGKMSDWQHVGRIEREKLEDHIKNIRRHPNMTFQSLLEKMLDYRMQIDSFFQKKIRNRLQEAQNEGRLTNVEFVEHVFSKIGRDTRRAIITGQSGVGKSKAMDTLQAGSVGLMLEDGEVKEHPYLTGNVGEFGVASNITSREVQQRDLQVKREGEKEVTREDLLHRFSMGLIVHAWEQNDADILFGNKVELMEFFFMNPYVHEAKRVYPSDVLHPTESLVICITTDPEQRIEWLKSRSGDAISQDRLQERGIPPETAMIVRNNGTLAQFKRDMGELTHIIIEAKKDSLLM